MHSLKYPVCLHFSSDYSACFCGFHISLLPNLPAVSDDKEQPEEVSKLLAQNPLPAIRWVTALLDVYISCSSEMGMSRGKKKKNEAINVKKSISQMANSMMHDETT